MTNINDGSTLVIDCDIILKNKTSYYDEWDSCNYNVCIKIENKKNLQIKSNRFYTIISDETSSNLGVKILFVNCENIEVDGLTMNGLNEYNQHILGNYSIKFYKSQHCTVKNCTIKNLSCGVAFNKCEHCYVINNTIGRINKDSYSGNYIGFHSCKHGIADGNTLYMGTMDGDLVCYGGNTDFKIVNNTLVNYDINSQDKTIGLKYAQGICVDAGASSITVTNNYCYGYQYGIDVKSSILSCIVSNNNLVRNNCGIAYRYGEAELQSDVCIISNNIINPNGGNGETYFPSWTKDYRAIGVLVERVNGVTISGNVFCNEKGYHGWFDGIVIDNEIGIEEKWWLSQVSIYNNQFLFMSSLGVDISKNGGHAVSILKSSCPVTINSNMFKLLNDSEDHCIITKKK